VVSEEGEGGMGRLNAEARRRRGNAEGEGVTEGIEELRDFWK
jgi:hypothetical protein